MGVCVVVLLLSCPVYKWWFSAQVDGPRVHCYGCACAGDSLLVPGATVATILMLGALHARRLYDDKKVNYDKS